MLSIDCDNIVKNGRESFLWSAHDLLYDSETRGDETADMKISRRISYFGQCGMY